MGLCGPSTCFTCKDKPTSMDACMCGCAYLNGNGAIFLVQLFGLMGSLLSVGSMIDCSFATIDPKTFDLGGGLEIEAMGVGFFFFQKADGHCYWYNEGGGETSKQNQFQTFLDLIGDENGRNAFQILTIFCAASSWLIFLYSITFCCSSQVKCIRYAIGFFMAGIVTIAQASTFIFYGRGFCQQNNCSFSRGSGTAIAAMACYVMAGMGLFFSSDYPGAKALEDNYDEDEVLVYEVGPESEQELELSGELGLPSEPSGELIIGQS